MNPRPLLGASELIFREVLGHEWVEGFFVGRTSETMSEDRGKAFVESLRKASEIHKTFPSLRGTRRLFVTTMPTGLLRERF